jgi:hypothetical protein
MYPLIPWEFVTDPLESAEHTLGTAAVDLYVLERIVVWDFSSSVHCCHVNAAKCLNAAI